MPLKACTGCGAIFVARHPSATVCGPACKHAVALKRTGVAVTCANCGKGFLKRRRDVERYPDHYCGRRCHAIADKVARLNAWKLAALRARLDKATTAVTAQPLLSLPVPTVPVKWCAQCKQTLPTTEFRETWCRSCTTAYTREWYRRNRAAVIRFTAGHCLECGTPFVSTSQGNRYCCEEHQARARRRRDKGIRNKRIRAAGSREQISLVAVAERDGWRCHICCRKVTRRNWSLDHLVPLRHNGTHTYDNVALAHHRCNSLRGATGQAQLLLVG